MMKKSKLDTSSVTSSPRIIKTIMDYYLIQQKQYFIKDVVFHNNEGRLTDEETNTLCKLAEATVEDFVVAELLLEQILSKYEKPKKNN